MNKETILNAYVGARSKCSSESLRIESITDDLKAGEKRTNYLNAAMLFHSEKKARRTRQMETFAARLAVVPVAKWGALADDTPLSDETMLALGANDRRIHCWGGGFEEVFIGLVYSEDAKREVVFVGNVMLRIGFTNCRTVGDLRQLYKMLTGEELK